MLVLGVSQGRHKFSEHLRNRFASLCGLSLRLSHKNVVHPQCKLYIHAVHFLTACTSRQSSFCEQSG